MSRPGERAVAKSWPEVRRRFVITMLFYALLAEGIVVGVGLAANNQGGLIAVAVLLLVLLILGFGIGYSALRTKYDQRD